MARAIAPEKLRILQWLCSVLEPSVRRQSLGRPLAGRSIPCQRLEDLLAYKTIVGRRDDLRELWLLSTPRA
jgi:hypothetical protein